MNESGRYTTRACECVMDKKGGFTIVPLGDIHYNAPMHARGLFTEYCRELAARIKGGESIYFLGMGDYLETFSGSERKAISGTLHESSQAVMDAMVEEACDGLIKKLEFSKGRWLGLLGGNHTYINGDGISTTSYLSQRFGAGESLGVQAAIRVYIPVGAGILTIDIRAHHGKGGGRLAGSTFNALEKFASGGIADLYLMGHDHRLGAIPGNSRLRLCGTRETLREEAVTPWLVRTGSFLKGYEPGSVSYAADKALPPLPIGTCEIRVSRSRKRAHGIDTTRDIRTQTPILCPIPRVLG